MAITNYSELQTAIQNWLARSNLTTAQCSEFIALGESFFKRPPLPKSSPGMGGIRSNKTRDSGTLTAGTNSLSLPADFQEADAFSLTADPEKELVFVTPDQIRQFRRSGSGKPTYFSISDVIEFDVAPDSAYAYELCYFPSIPALSDSNTTNWLLTKFPDCYLAASMFWASRYIMSEEAGGWAAQYKEAAALVSLDYLRGRSFQGPVSIQLQRKP